MTERNHRNTLGQYKVSSNTCLEADANQVSENDFCVRDHCFPKKHILDDNSEIEGPESFTPHIITRMPNLTGYGHDTAPQGISLYRPSHGQTQFHLEILKKLRKMPLHKWCAILVIVAVTGIIGWGFFAASDSPQVAQKSTLNHSEPGMMSPVNVTPLEPMRPATPQVGNEYQFAEFGRRTPSSRATDDQSAFLIEASTFPSSQNHYGPQSIVPVDTPASEMPPYPSGVTDVAMMAPDAPFQGFAPWDRQPSSTPNGTMSIAMANTGLPSFTGATAGMAQVVSHESPVQETHSPSMQLQNGQYQPVSHQQSFVGMTNEYGSPQIMTGPGIGMSNGSSQFNGGTYSPPSVTPYNLQQNQQQLASHQIADGFGAMPQQVSSRQYPGNQGIAVAANTNAMPSYAQVQGQRLMQNPGDNYYAPQNQQQPYSGNGSPSTTQGQMQSLPQSGMSNVPVVSSGQSYRDTGVLGTNLPGTTNQYPGIQPQQPYPYPNTPVMQTPNFYY